MIKELVGTPKLISMFDKAKAGGENFYDNQYSVYYRIKKLRLENKSIRMNKNTGQKEIDQNHHHGYDDHGTRGGIAHACCTVFGFKTLVTTNDGYEKAKKEGFKKAG